LVRRARLRRSASPKSRTRMKVVKLTPIQKRIIEMLRENTGAHILDSGDIYGRHWERNQKRDFLKEPVVMVDGYKDGDWSLKVSTYHFLTNHLDVTPESEKLNRDFRRFANRPENKDKPWLAVMEEWMEKLFPDQKTLVDLYGSEDGQITKVDNTYNYDNLLDQVLQYMAFRKGGKDFILLQIHNGCDVRGGYTAPQVFEVSTAGGEGIADWIWDMTNVRASDGKKSWYSDDSGYHWYELDTGKDADISRWRFDVKKGRVINLESGKPIEFSVGWV